MQKNRVTLLAFNILNLKEIISFFSFKKIIFYILSTNNVYICLKTE